MGKAYLTIDDIPQGVTKDMVDYLNLKGIPAVMFVVGENAEKDLGTVVYAIRHGILIGNHSYTHPSFSDITYEEAVEEIEKTDRLIEQAYKEAGVERPVKLFRFPYLDKGGENKELFQNYLRENGYKAVDDTGVMSRGYIEAGWNKDLDVACSFDCQEYLVPSGEKNFEEIIDRIEEGDVGMGSNVITDECDNIILLHSHDDTEAVKKGYYRDIIEHMLNKGTDFKEVDFK